jgi:hypothetical protein
MTKIIEVMKFFIRDTMARACRRSRKVMEAKMKADGHFLQYIAQTFINGDILKIWLKYVQK